RRTDNIDTLAPQEAAALVAQGQNAAMEAFFEKYGHMPTSAELTKFLGSSFGQEGYSDELALNAMANEMFPGTIWQKGTGSSSPMENISFAMALRANSSE